MLNAECQNVEGPGRFAAPGLFFHITFRNAEGSMRVVRRAPGMTVARTHPLQAHIDLLDRLTDRQIHDLVAYLETMKRDR